MRKRLALPEHQGSRRVTPLPQVRQRRGFLLPALAWIIAGIVYMTAAFWIFVATHSGGNESPVNFRDESYCMDCR